MTQNGIIDEYFEWMVGLLMAEDYPKTRSFRRLQVHLHGITFRYSLPMDSNRFADGIRLRYRFAIRNGYEDVSDVVESYLSGPCSVLEMMLALAIRCEEDIMADPLIGDRTSQWFWSMIISLGLGSVTDQYYDPEYIDEVVERFLSRSYEADGRGGLFRIKNPPSDLRNVEIWYQLCWYLDALYN